MITSDGGSLNPETTFYEDGLPFIAHYGVLGMKWGVRNAETKERYARERKAAKARKVETKNINKKRKAAAKSRKKMRDLNQAKVKTIRDERLEANRNRSLLSDEELNQRINRLQKEQRLNQLTQAELQPGRYMVKSALVTVGSSTIKAETKGLIGAGKAAVSDHVIYAPHGKNVGSASKVRID